MPPSPDPDPRTPDPITGRPKYLYYRSPALTISIPGFRASSPISLSPVDEEAEFHDAHSNQGGSEDGLSLSSNSHLEEAFEVRQVTAQRPIPQPSPVGLQAAITLTAGSSTYRPDPFACLYFEFDVNSEAERDEALERIRLQSQGVERPYSVIEMMSDRSNMVIRAFEHMPLWQVFEPWRQDQERLRMRLPGIPVMFAHGVDPVNVNWTAADFDLRINWFFLEVSSLMGGPDGTDPSSDWSNIWGNPMTSPPSPRRRGQSPPDLSRHFESVLDERPSSLDGAIGSALAGPKVPLRPATRHDLGQQQKAQPNADSNTSAPSDSAVTPTLADDPIPLLQAAEVRPPGSASAFELTYVTPSSDNALGLTFGSAPEIPLDHRLGYYASSPLRWTGWPVVRDPDYPISETWSNNAYQASARSSDGASSTGARRRVRKGCRRCREAHRQPVHEGMGAAVYLTLHHLRDLQLDPLLKSVLEMKDVVNLLSDEPAKAQVIQRNLLNRAIDNLAAGMRSNRDILNLGVRRFGAKVDWIQDLQDRFPRVSAECEETVFDPTSPVRATARPHEAYAKRPYPEFAEMFSTQIVEESAAQLAAIRRGEPSGSLPAQKSSETPLVAVPGRPNQRPGPESTFIIKTVPAPEGKIPMGPPPLPLTPAAGPSGTGWSIPQTPSMSSRTEHFLSTFATPSPSSVVTPEWTEAMTRNTALVADAKAFQAMSDKLRDYGNQFDELLNDMRAMPRSGQAADQAELERRKRASEYIVSESQILQRRMQELRVEMTRKKGYPVDAQGQMIESKGKGRRKGENLRADADDIEQMLMGKKALL